MRRAWPYLIAVTALGALAGVAIAGRPEPSDPFVVNPGSVVVTTAASATTTP